jgi:hypothetical protein
VSKRKHKVNKLQRQINKFVATAGENLSSPFALTMIDFFIYSLRILSTSALIDFTSFDGIIVREFCFNFSTTLISRK